MDDVILNLIAPPDPWEEVPGRVERLYAKYAGTARKLVEQNPEAGEVALLTDEFGPMLIKRGGAPLAWWKNISDRVQGALGGPNPMTAMLLHGALGAGLGYGGGWLASHLMPGYVKKDVTRVTTPIGALMGAAIPGMLHAYPNMLEYGPQGLFQPTPLQGGPAYPDTEELLKNRPMGKLGLASRFDWVLDELERKVRIKCAFDEDDDYERERARIEAEDDASLRAARASNYAGGLYVPQVNVDEWGQVITRDPFIPAASKAMIIGVPAAAAAATGSRWVTPSDVARVAANMGLGYGIGSAIGMVAGPLLRLTPAAQRDIQRAGMLAAAFKTVGLLG